MATNQLSAVDTAHVREGDLLDMCYRAQNLKSISIMISNLQSLGSSGAPHALAARMLRDKLQREGSATGNIYESEFSEPSAVAKLTLRLEDALPHEASQGQADAQESLEHRKPRNFSVASMNVILQTLALEDPNTIVVVRGLGCLGREGLSTLRSHCSQHGHVINILRCDSARGAFSRRPGSMAFVQMQTATMAFHILRQGSEQYVNGKKLNFQKWAVKPAMRDAAFADSREDEEGQGAEWADLQQLLLATGGVLRL